MSNAALHMPIPLEQPQHEPSRRLVDIPRALPRRGSRLAHGAVALLGLAVIVVAQLLMSSGLSAGAFELESMRAEQAQADRSHQALQEHISSLQAPQNLAASAEGLGMVNSDRREYIKLSSGTIAQGPDDMHIDSSARTASSRLAVPNELVQSERDLSAIRESRALDAQRQRESQGYPGMLLPSPGVAEGG